MDSQIKDSLSNVITTIKKDYVAKYSSMVKDNRIIVFSFHFN